MSAAATSGLNDYKQRRRPSHSLAVINIRLPGTVFIEFLSRLIQIAIFLKLPLPARSRTGLFLTILVEESVEGRVLDLKRW